MNIFAFFLQNFSKIFSKTHQIAPLKKNFLSEHTPVSPSKHVASPCKYPHFYTNILTPPPPPEIKS